MKKPLNLLVLAMYAAFVLQSCSKEAETITPNATAKSNSSQHRIANTCGEPKTVALIAGQNIVAGNVTVSNTETDLIVTYTTGHGWYIKELHLYAGDCARIPTNNSGNPIPGRFPFNNSFSGTATTTYTYTIPLANLPECYCIAAHAVVAKPGAGTETAWGQGTRFVSRGNWAMKFEYCTQRCEPVEVCAYNPQEIIGNLSATWPTTTVTVGGFTYTQQEAYDIYNEPTTDAKTAFIYIAAIKLSGANVPASEPVQADVATIDAWLATLGKLSPANLPYATGSEGSIISGIKGWADDNQCD